MLTSVENDVTVERFYHCMNFRRRPSSARILWSYVDVTMKVLVRKESVVHGQDPCSRDVLRTLKVRPTVSTKSYLQVARRGRS